MTYRMLHSYTGQSENPWAVYTRDEHIAPSPRTTHSIFATLLVTVSFVIESVL
jgi:hypothetical protein